MKIHKIRTGPISHRRLVGSKMTDLYDLTCTCGETFTAKSPKDVLATWKAHRRSPAEEATL